MRRARITGQAAVNRAVNDLLNKFEYPNIDTVGGTFIGGGGGAPTVVIAASDASDMSKQKADWQTAGINDSDTLQAVIDQFASVSARILLTEGTFTLGDTVTVSGGVSLVGMGNAATYVVGDVDLGATLALGDGSMCADLYAENSANNAAATGIDLTGASLVDNCVVSTFGGAAIELSADNGVVRFCRTDGGSHGIRHTGGNYVWIVDNYVESDAIGISVESDYGQVLGNLVDNPTTHGIVAAGDNGTFRANRVDSAGSGSSNTYDNYQVTGSNNTVVANDSMPAAATRYGVNVASGSNNVVHGNDLGDSSVYATADSVDNGTATRTLADDGVIGGQFAY